MNADKDNLEHELTSSISLSLTDSVFMFPTNQLRYVKITTPLSSIHEKYDYQLQQLWKAMTGQEEWRDIEIVDSETIKTK